MHTQMRKSYNKRIYLHYLNSWHEINESKKIVIARLPGPQFSVQVVLWPL